MKRSAIIIIIALLMLSCEGNRFGNGIVYDQATLAALDSVSYKNIGDSDLKYTDSTGAYHVSGPFGGCISGCPDYKVEFSKPGYKTLARENPNKNIYLEHE